MKVAIYVRVSTKIQSNDLQLDELKKYAEEKKFSVVNIYIDKVTGEVAKRKVHTEYDALMKDAEAKLFDCVLVWKFDRFARSLIHLVQALDRFQQLGIHFISRNENIDTTTAMGRAFFQMIALFAEFEKNMIVERMSAGRKYAMENGVKFGPKSRNGKLVANDLQKSTIISLYEKGFRLKAISGTMQMPLSTIYFILKRSVCKVPCRHGKYFHRACRSAARVSGRTSTKGHRRILGEKS